MITKICLQCSKEFETINSKIKSGRGKYCSKKCSNFGRRTKVKRNCLQCSKEFEIHLCYIKSGGGKYCSNKCKRNKVKKNCLNCNNKFEAYPSEIKKGKGHGKYCSRKCSANYIGLSKRTRVKKNCLQCNKKFEEIPSRLKKGRGKCCSKKCWYLSNCGKNNYLWRGGIALLPYDLNFTQRYKILIRQRDNHICQKCNVTEEEHLEKYNKVLSIHHIDYIKTNTFKENNITLCTRCNFLVNKDREVWTKHFQELLKTNYGYEYTSDQKIILDYN